ncbi:MAG: Rid family hydrolase, partial [Exiguobacterium acetylicum]
MRNVDAILKEAGLTPDRVVKTTCYLTSMEHFASFNTIYSDYFAPHDHFPARSCIAVKELPKGALVEVEILGLV